MVLYRYSAFTLIATLCLSTSGQLAHCQQKPGAIAPAEKPMDGKWEEIDQRLIFLLVRIANLEASLDAVENTLEAAKQPAGMPGITDRR